MFFDDNTFLLRKGNPMGERLAKVPRQKGFLLMMCDSSALERGLAEGAAWPKKAKARDTVQGVQVGRFPDLYAALQGANPDHIITL
jgi:sulfur relay (sulfurtransferase) complex TusBCD TusD component (DsrE family)